MKWKNIINSKTQIQQWKTNNKTTNRKKIDKIEQEYLANEIPLMWIKQDKK